jgi:hypothetical protein
MTEPNNIQNFNSDAMDSKKHLNSEEIPQFRLQGHRMTGRLSGSSSSLHGRRRSGEWHHGRSRSPSMRDAEDSSLSSIDSSDILTDRLAFEDLDIPKHHKYSSDMSASSLHPVHERMTDTSLEDVNAFSELTRTTASASSKANSIATVGEVGSLILETLDECEDEEDAGVHTSNLDEGDEEESLQSIDDVATKEKVFYYTDEDLPPLRMNAVRVPDRLAMSHASFFQPSNNLNNSFSSPTQSTRSTISQGGASLPSRRGVDLSTLDRSDILTDKKAFQELDLERQRLENSSIGSLPPVNERMSDDTLEDCHAFTDVRATSSVASSARSVANSIATGADATSLFLETLDEEDEYDDDAREVHISNLENLTFQENYGDAASKKSEISDMAIASDYTQPYRLNATRVPERLSSSYVPSAQHFSRRRSGEMNRGRSRSPSIKDGDNSSISSMDGSDIMTDRMGLEDLEISKLKHSSEGSVSSLPPVQERLSVETLDDVHAFNDISRPTGGATSKANSVADNSLLLETLDECDDEEDCVAQATSQNDDPTARPNLSEKNVSDWNQLRPNHSSFLSNMQALSPSPSQRKKHLPKSMLESLDKSGPLNLSLTNLEETDILTDHRAFEDLDAERQKIDNSSFGSLHTVNERMSDETLEDCHAFLDLRITKQSSGRSVANSVTGEALSLLGTLDENDEENVDDDDDKAGVLISNLESLDARDKSYTIS